MKLIEAYNETYTREILGRLYDQIDKTKSVSFNDIYYILGCEYEDMRARRYCGDYTYLDIKQYCSNLYPQSVLEQIFSAEQKAFNRGDYFHMILNLAVTPNERMIINVDNQYNASLIVGSLRTYGKPIICSAKFYAHNGEGVEANAGFKYDKVVIYYDTTNRSAVFDVVLKAGVLPTFLIPKISAFYHLCGGVEGYFPVGVGVEIENTSFTTERAKKILLYLTSQKYQEGMNDKTQYPVSPDKLSNREDFINSTFSEGKADVKPF